MIDKEKLKELREIRKHRIKEIREIVKEQNKIKESIKNALKNGSKTVPEISEKTYLPKDTVMWYIASLKKYGEVLEGDKQGDYFSYILVEDKAL
ncbi:hypothetical protein [Desulfothermus sp.]